MSFARCVAGEHLGSRSIEGGINGDTRLGSAMCTGEDACDSHIGFGGLVALPCLPTDNCPRVTKVAMHALPSVAVLA
jgi:hypothetical protein